MPSKRQIYRTSTIETYETELSQMKIAPSILAADFGRLAEEIMLVEEGGADFLHFDIMDGSFVPSLSFGPMVVKSIRNRTRLPFEVHLMVEEPERFVVPFIEAGADMVTIHVECFHRLYATIEAIRSFGKKVGIALNPPTSLNTVEYLLENVDMLLVMTVDPGFGGQRFIQGMLSKIKEARKVIDKKGLKVELAIDGGVDEKIAPLVAGAGADILVAGSAVFNRKDPKKALETLRKSLQ